MAIEDVARRVTYTGNGKQTDFSFSFVVFNAQTDIAVYRKASDDADEELVSANEYSVTLNSDQASNPGGKVTMTSAPATGATLALLSNVAYEQTMELTTHDGFDPRTLNKNADRIVAMIQQLKESMSRVVMTDATDTMTAAELKKKLVEAASAAYDVAMAQAAAAKQSATEAAQSATEAKEARDEAYTHLDEVKAAVTAEGDKQDARVIAEGDTQIERIKLETDNAIIANGTGGAEKAWTASEAIPAGTAITIPGGLKYIVNRHHLRVSWNGMTCFIGLNFTEVGDEDTYSTDFKLTFDVQAGDELDVWIGALGKGEVADAIAKAGEAVSAVADLSRKVVYKEEVTE